MPQASGFVVGNRNNPEALPVVYHFTYHPRPAGRNVAHDEVDRILLKVKQGHRRAVRLFPIFEYLLRPAVLCGWDDAFAQAPDGSITVS